MSKSHEIIIPWPEPSGTRIIECVEVKVHTGYIWARLESGHSIRIENPQNVIIIYPPANGNNVPALTREEYDEAFVPWPLKP